MNTTGTYILTHTGKHFRFSHPEESVCSEDIAHALARLCRFTGHTNQFYSVAQHSVLVSRLVVPEHRLAALLHDASEAYLGDVSMPLKSLLPEYRQIERRVQGAIMAHFGLPPELPPEVKYADMQMLALERSKLMPEDLTPWPCLEGVEMPKLPLVPWHAARAGVEFWNEFNKALGSTAGTQTARQERA